MISQQKVSARKKVGAERGRSTSIFWNVNCVEFAVSGRTWSLLSGDRFSVYTSPGQPQDEGLCTRCHASCRGVCKLQVPFSSLFYSPLLHSVRSRPISLLVLFDISLILKNFGEEDSISLRTWIYCLFGVTYRTFVSIYIWICILLTSVISILKLLLVYV